MDFSDSHAGINFLVGDTHPDKTIMLMSFSFFPDFKVFCFFLEKQNMNAEGMHTSTHTLTQICFIINQSVAHLLACSVCFFPINKALIAFSLECDLACCLWTDLEGPTLTSPSLFFLKPSATYNNSVTSRCR